MTRRSAEQKKEEQPMEQDVSKQIEDVEMADLAPVVSSAYSASNLAQNVDNIDKDDVENPQLVMEYVNEIYGYLRQLEVLQGIHNFQLKMG